jgi:hypothetical protein
VKNALSLLLLILTVLPLSAQRGIIRGKVINKVNNEPVAFAHVLLLGTNYGVAASDSGVYEIKNLNEGLYTIHFSFVGYTSVTIDNVAVRESAPTLMTVELQETAKQLDEVIVEGTNTFVASAESPVSLRTIGPTEIKRAPGANRDISKIVRVLPGVASTPTFRNDLFIRGGSPIENTFYLDGIQVPVINHFQTQGGTGGPMGIINVDMLSEVSFYSGAFPANRGNTLSSVFDFRLREARSDRWSVSNIIGASDVGLTFEGPVSKKSTLLFSMRRSYLKFLFSVFNMPYLPIYNDIQFKYKIKLSNNDHITLLGLGAKDKFQLNFSAPEDAASEDKRKEAQYLINIAPISDQWSYVVGAKWDHLRKSGITTFVSSFNMLNNRSIKYLNNNERNPDDLLQRYNSEESDLRLRLEDNSTHGETQVSYGIAFDRGRYDTDDYTKIVTSNGNTVRDFRSLLTIHKWGIFAQISRPVLKKLTLSLGVRADANDYSGKMNDLLDQISPRISASYTINPLMKINFNTGIYYQLPAYTMLGYRSTTTHRLVNKDNGLKYMRAKHLVGGVEFILPKNSRFTVEGFHKWYDQYPFVVEKQVSMANFGADYGVAGSTLLTSTSEGRSYGLEVLLQQKLYQGFYGLLSYTFVRSEFKNAVGAFTPSSWDSRHLISLTGGKKFKNNWEVGMRWLFTGGTPYTPYHVTQTVLRENWDVRPYGIPDYTQLNSQRIRPFHQLDIRVDKKIFFGKWSADFYFDLQNAYNYVTHFQDNIDVQRDASGQPVVDPDNTDYYVPDFIQSTAGTVLPTIGLIIEL